jgi:acyl-coenzyme A thioesterase PaaI-like protein
MAIPNPEFVAPAIDDVLERFATPMGRLPEPIAERIGCERVAPGETVLPCTPIVHNGSKAINGGLLAVAVEEAALSAGPVATRIESLHLRFLRAVRVGPARVRADVHHGMARVEVVDEASGAVAAIATTRAAS